MLIRAAFVGDTHARRDVRWDEHTRVMRWIADDMRAREVDVVGHAGDMFDGASVPEERDFEASWCQAVTRYADLVVVKGNHDHDLEIDFLRRLETKRRLYAFERPDVVDVNGIRFACLPWPRAAELVAALGAPVAPEALQATANSCLQNILRGFGGLLAGAAGPRVVLAHAMVHGSRTDADQPIMASDLTVHPSDLALAQADFYALGHVHAQNEFNIGGATAAYTSSPYSVNLGEPGARGYLYVEFEVRSDGTRHVRWERVRTPARPILHLEAELSGGTFGSVRTDVQNAEVRFRYTYRRADQDAARAAAADVERMLRGLGAHEVHLDPRPLVETRARAPEVARALTLSDKLTAHWASKNLPIAPAQRARIDLKLEGLERKIDWRQGAYAGGALELQHVEIRGFHPFREKVELDFRTMPGPLVAVHGPNGAGKCLPGSATVYVPGAGPTRIDAVVRQKAPSLLGLVDGRIVPVPVVNWFSLGAKAMVTVTARGWPRTMATTHPVLTARGWKLAGELRPGDHIASPRALPMHRDQDGWSDDEVRLAGYLIADGILNGGVRLCAQLDWKVAEFERCLGAVFPGGTVYARAGVVGLQRGAGTEAGNLRIAAAVADCGRSIWEYLKSNTPRFLRGECLLDADTVTRLRTDGVDLPADGYLTGRRDLDAWAETFGLHGLAAEKSLGAFAAVTDRHAATLLGALWFGDGYVSPDAREVSYTTASAVLAGQVRDLLLRIGVLSSRHTKAVNGTRYYAIVILAKHRLRFAEATLLRGPKGDRLCGVQASVEGATNADSLPFAVWNSAKLNGDVSPWRRNESGMTRERFVALGGDRRIADQELWWCPVDSVEAAGEAECFDVEVGTEEHAYVADATIVHNSALVELCMPGAMYRRCPTHGLLTQQAVARDAYLRSTILNGAVHTIEHTVDHVTGDGTSVLKDEHGKPRGERNAKKTSFDQIAKRLFPPEDVFLAGQFSAQEAKGFLELTDGDRAGLVLQASGVAGIERVAEGAREELRTARAEHAAARAALVAEEKRLGVHVQEGDDARPNDPVDAAAGALVAAEQEAAAHDATVVDAEAALAGAREESARAREAAVAAEAAIAVRRAAEARVEAVRAAIARLEAEREDLARTLAEADAVAEAEQEDAALATEDAKLEITIAAARSTLAAAERAANEARVRAQAARVRAAAAEADAAKARAAAIQRAEEARRQASTAADRVAAAEKLVAGGAELRAQAARLAQLTEDRQAAALAETRAEAERAGHATAAAASAREAAGFEEQIAQAERRADALRKVLADREAVRAAAATLPALRAEVERASTAEYEAEEHLAFLRDQRIAGADERIVDLRAGLTDIVTGDPAPAARAALTIARDDDAAKRALEYPAEVRAAEDAIATASAARAAAEAKLTAAERLAARVVELDAAEAELATVEEAHQAHRARLDDARARAAAGQADEEKAAAALAGACAKREAAMRASAELGHVPAAITALTQAEATLDGLRLQRAEADARVQAAEAEVAALPDEAPGAAAAQAEASVAIAEAAEAEAVAAAGRGSIVVAEARRSAIAARREALGALLSLAADVAAARALAPKVAEDLGRARAEADAAGAALEAAPVAPTAPAPPDVAGAEARVREANAARLAAHAAVARARAALETAQAAAAQLADQRASCADLEAHLSDWVLLADGLGKDGVQAAEVDSAGPELTELANDLLERCHGGRYTVAIETSRPNADGKKQIEGCRVMVLDAESGREKDGRQWSPGQRTILNEACALALTMFSCRRAGVTRPTLVRDEADDGLSPENAQSYVALLRRAAEVLGSRHVIFISHKPHVIALADARIHVGPGGRVEVQP